MVRCYQNGHRKCVPTRLYQRYRPNSDIRLGQGRCSPWLFASRRMPWDMSRRTGMAEERVQRRLAAILASDVVSYSRLMGEDEESTLFRQTWARYTP
jgi:class 3 adenylate cyclase